jgi:hypothetical protein
MRDIGPCKFLQGCDADFLYLVFCAFLDKFLDGLLAQTLERGLVHRSLHAIKEGVVFSENDNNGNFDPH